MADWQEQLRHDGTDAWRETMQRKLELYPARRAEYEKWLRSPRGRITLRLRRVRAMFPRIGTAA